jgi:hypothetical protein
MWAFDDFRGSCRNGIRKPKRPEHAWRSSPTLAVRVPTGVRRCQRCRNGKRENHDAERDGKRRGCRVLVHWCHLPEALVLPPLNSYRLSRWVFEVNRPRQEAWVVDYVDQRGRRHVMTFDRKKSADAYHASVRVEVRPRTAAKGRARAHRPFHDQHDGGHPWPSVPARRRSRGAGGC